MDSQTTRKCPNCGHENLLTSRFCAICGTRLIGVEDSAPSDNDPSGATEPSSTSPVPAFRVRNWDDPRDAGEAVERSSSYDAYGRFIPRPPEQKQEYAQPTGQAQPALPAGTPVRLGRIGNSTFLPYNTDVARRLEANSLTHGWLVPVLVASVLLLALLGGVAGYLLVNPSSAGFGPTYAPAQSQCRLPDKPTEEDQVRYVVCRSNEIQVRSWVDLNQQALQETLTGSELQKQIQEIEQLKQNNLYGKLENTRLDITSVKVTGSTATVQTVEQWSVTFYDRQSNRQFQKRGPDTYNETYHLVKQNGKWLIDVINVPDPSNSNGV